MAVNAAISLATGPRSTPSMSSPSGRRHPGLPPSPLLRLSISTSISRGSRASSIPGPSGTGIGVTVVKSAVGEEPDAPALDAAVPIQASGGVSRGWKQPWRWCPEGAEVGKLRAPAHRRRIGVRVVKCAVGKEPDPRALDASVPIQEVGSSDGAGVLKMLRSANSVLPHVVLGSTVLALAYPPSFTWFTTKYYAPALGFLMFAVGVNSNPKDFLEAIKRPKVIFIGYVGQFIVKPILGCLFGTISMKAFHLSNSIGAGIMLTSCVSGAQLSNYATFLTDPSMAPLSIVMTSVSTATAALMTPALSFLLIGKRLPVDMKGMMSSIIQIVVAPIAAGLLLNRFLPRVCAAIQPFLPPLSVLVTSLCVGSPLAINMKSIVSRFGVTILLLVFGFHASSFVAGYFLTGVVFKNVPDLEALKRTLSFETGMQSSLLALALANKFFQDPLVGVPPAISVVIMSLMGFVLVMVWSNSKLQSMEG